MFINFKPVEKHEWVMSEFRDTSKWVMNLLWIGLFESLSVPVCIIIIIIIIIIIRLLLLFCFLNPRKNEGGKN